MGKNFTKQPFIEVSGDYHCFTGWKQMAYELNRAIEENGREQYNIVVECYQGVYKERLLSEIARTFPNSTIINAEQAMKDESVVKEMIWPDVTDDRIFGFMSRLNIEDFYDSKRIKKIQRNLDNNPGVHFIVGTGASVVSPHCDLLIYADMARWEIQQRMRRHEVDNLGIRNRETEDWMLLYKQGYFVDWRVCDRLKKRLHTHIDYLLDTNKHEQPKLVSYKAIRDGLKQTVRQPFSVVPFFDPGPWGGQWMKKVCDLDQSVQNYAWCFNCVPEENSLLLKISGQLIEIPSINLVFTHPGELLGEPVHARFGDEFPIRFDYLDTMDGGNLSLQVHPLTEYIQEKFGVNYTQDESYYLMETGESAKVYLGLKEGVDKQAFIEDLEKTQTGTEPFNTEKYVETWPVKKHDHFLIPGGTIHCSGKNCVVLEISATPYIFTFKLWDWGRLGLDGKPRPINIDHAKNVIQWDRTASWTKKQLVNRIDKVAEGEGWIEERTGLHEREFIETRRHWFTGKVEHIMSGSVEVLNLVEGDEIIVESPNGSFNPFKAHYAETFIVPAVVGRYTIRPNGNSEGKRCATIKAYVRF